MAKAKTNAESQSVATEQLSKTDQVQFALTAICAITGCGRVEAKARLAKLGDEVVQQIAQLEHSGKRREVIPILYS